MNHAYIAKENQMLDIYTEDEGMIILCECLREASKALGTRFTMSDLMMTSNTLLSLCVFGAWMKRIGQN